MKRILSEKDVETLAGLVKPYLTEKRYSHTVSVANEAVKIGRLYGYSGEDLLRLKASGLLHDITKKQDSEKQLQYCREFGIILSSDEIMSKRVLHAITAEKLAERDFTEYTDGEILSGVRWHTTGRREMTLFDCIIFLADYIEPTREFDDCVKVRQYFYDKIECVPDRNEVMLDTMIYSFDLTIENLIRESDVIHHDTIEARNYFLEMKSSGGRIK